MFNFFNLNDYEFELLSTDVINLITNDNFRYFKKGRDGGVDLKSLDSNKIAQCKHYINTGTSGLISALKKEVTKIKTENYSDYYVITSVSLTNNNIDEIYNLFSFVMKSKNNIIDGAKIEEILSEPKNKTVFYKHTKLWLCNSNTLDLLLTKSIMMDSEDLVEDIKKDAKFYVDTKDFHECVKILKNNNVLLISGEPGVGKTTISYMLLLYYLNMDKHYNVRYSSCKNISGLKDSIVLEENEIILLDDFLGQIYSVTEENDRNDLLAFISYIKRCKNKILIMNSRIIILNDVYSRDDKFKRKMVKYGVAEYRINHFSLIDKAAILKNRLYFSLDSEYYNAIVSDEKYKTIINHKNYNPRIIEYCTSPLFVSGCKVNDYYKKFMEQILYPDQIWKIVYEEQLNRYDRILLQSIFSLGEYVIDEDVLKNAFNKGLEKIRADHSINQFEKSLIKMNGSVISLFGAENIKKVKVINPSVNDFLKKYIASDITIAKSIIESAYYDTQIRRIVGIMSSDMNDVVDGLGEKLMFVHPLSEPRYSLYIEMISKRQINNTKELKQILDFVSEVDYSKNQNLNNILQNIIFINNSFLKIIIELIESGNFIIIEKICHNVSSISFITLINSMYKFDQQIIVKNAIRIKTIIRNAYYADLKYSMLSYMKGNIYSVISDILDEVEYEFEENYDDICCEAADRIKKIAKEKSQTLVMTFICSNFNLHLSEHDIDMIIKEIDINDYVDTVIRYYMDPPEPDYDDYEDEHHYMSDDSAYSIIDDMFR